MTIPVLSSTQINQYTVATTSYVAPVASLAANAGDCLVIEFSCDGASSGLPASLSGWNVLQSRVSWISDSCYCSFWKSATGTDADEPVTLGAAVKGQVVAHRITGWDGVTSPYGYTYNAYTTATTAYVSPGSGAGTVTNDALVFRTVALAGGGGISVYPTGSGNQMYWDTYAGGGGGHAGIGICTHNITGGNTVPAASWTLNSAFRGGAFTFVIEGNASAFVLDTKPTTLARGQTGVAFGASGGGLLAAQGTGSITVNGDALTIESWSDTLIYATVPLSTPLQHSAAGYDITVTNDNGDYEIISNIPLTPGTGWDYINLVDPVTVFGSLLYNYSGDLPVTGDQLVFTTPTSPDSVGFVVNPAGEWVIATTPPQNQYITCYVIQVSGAVGPSDVITYLIGSSPAPSGGPLTNEKPLTNDSPLKLLSPFGA